MNIGEIISAFDVLQQQVTSPVQQLRKEIDLMRSELSGYEAPGEAAAFRGHL